MIYDVVQLLLWEWAPWTWIVGAVVFALACAPQGRRVR